MKTAESIERFKTAALELDSDGIMTIRLHSRGASLKWNALPHRELPEVFERIAADGGIKVVILTGTGGSFTELDASFEERIVRGESSATQMDEGTYEARRLIDNLLRIGVPVIAAVNGPAPVHAELAVLSDIVICTDDTYLQDAAHVPCGLLPGDGVQVVWPLLLGPNRGRYFLLTGERIAADEAKTLGIVSEVVARDDLYERAMAHARRLAACNPVFLRNLRDIFVRPLRRAMALDLDFGLALEAVTSLSGVDWGGPPSPSVMDAR
jgi:enoyl-CoA hydratase/carnithine racemase